jgi:RNA polymerase sigma-70 factor (ECF subfamily)
MNGATDANLVIGQAVPVEAGTKGEWWVRQLMAPPADPSELDDFQALVAAHQAGIYRLGYRLTGNRDDAEDLVQEALIEAFQAFGRFRAGTHFDRWVYRIMTRTYIDKFRRRKRFDPVPLDDAALNGDRPELTDSSSDPQQVLERTMTSAPVQEALDRLPPEFRAAVVLCDVQEASYEEAARALGCPVGTVRSRLHRARHLLRNWLQPLLADNEEVQKR